MYHSQMYAQQQHFMASQKARENGQEYPDGAQGGYPPPGYPAPPDGVHPGYQESAHHSYEEQAPHGYPQHEHEVQQDHGHIHSHHVHSHGHGQQGDIHKDDHIPQPHADSEEVDIKGVDGRDMISPNFFTSPYSAILEKRERDLEEHDVDHDDGSSQKRSRIEEQKLPEEREF